MFNLRFIDCNFSIFQVSMLHVSEKGLFYEIFDPILSQDLYI